MVSIECIETDNTLSIQVDGHAGSAEHGKDLVCASVSILAHTAAESMRVMASSGMLCKDPKITMEEGHAVMTINPYQHFFYDCKTLLIVCQIGFDLLAKEYPQFVELKTFGGV